MKLICSAMGIVAAVAGSFYLWGFMAALVVFCAGMYLAEGQLEEALQRRPGRPEA